MNKNSDEYDDSSIPNLLTIKQAARVLNVSEVSLRRWTNAGQLACLRVGTHRARRFRRSDLMAFMEKQSSRNATNTASKADVKVALSGKQQTHVMLEGSAISYGSHLCSLYDDTAGQLKLSVPFLAEGLNQGDICFLIAVPKTRKIILQQLSEIGLDTKFLLDTDQLVVSDGMSNSPKMLEFLREQFQLATRSGSRSMRLVGDMSWALAKKWSAEELNSYEISYNNSIGHQYSIVSLCQYDVRDFNGQEMLSALRSHKDTFHYPLSRFLGTTPVGQGQ